MSEKLPHPSPEIAQVVAEILEDCRNNMDAYDSPSGIKIKVGEADWSVSYWPEYPGHKESLSILRDWDRLENPVSYQISPGLVRKNSTITDRLAGGVFFDPSAEEAVLDDQEVLTLQAIVRAAHQLKS